MASEPLGQVPHIDRVIIPYPPMSPLAREDECR